MRLIRAASGAKEGSMLRLRPTVIAAILGGLLLHPLSTLAPVDVAEAQYGAPPVAPAAQIVGPGVGVQLSGLDFGGEVRYSVNLTRAAGVDLGKVLVEVFLPASANFVRAMESPGRTEFLGATANTLQWAGAFGPADPLDAFTFFLQEQPPEEISVTVSWGADGQTGITTMPEVVGAWESEGEAIIPAEGDVAIGSTGARVAGASPAAAGAVAHVALPGPDANPPATLGSFWWCALVDLSGLPTDSSAFVTVPARQALAPNAEISLFGLVDDEWQPLEDRGFVSPDGQLISFIHRGGLVAPGTAVDIQPIASPVRTTVPLDPAAIKLPANVNVTPPTGADIRVTGLTFQPGGLIQGGAPLTASFTVRNFGTVSSQAGVTVSATPPAGLELAQPLAPQPGVNVACGPQGPGVGCTMPTLANGESRVVTIGLRAGTPQTTIHPCLSVSAEVRPQDPNAANNNATACVTITPAGSADTSVKLQRTGDLVLDQTVTYTATMAVEQGATSGPVVLNVNISPTDQIVSWATPGWTCSGGPTASSRQCTTTDRVSAPQAFPAIVVTAVVKGCGAALKHSVTSGPDSISTNNESTLDETPICPSWSQTLTPALDRVRLAQTQSFSVILKNAGTAPTLGSATYTFKVPIEMQTNLAGTGSGWSCQPAQGALTCTTGQVLQPGGTTLITVTAQPSMGAGFLSGMTNPTPCPSGPPSPAMFSNPVVTATGNAAGGNAATTVTKAVSFQIGSCA
jgi:hypothetical protein